MQSEYQLFQFDNFIEQAAISMGKPVVFIRTYGWNNSTDIDKINESMEVYKNLVPLDMFDIMKSCEFSFMVLENIDDAMLFFEETFPASQADCEKEFYVFYSIVNELGQTVLSNE